MSETTTLPEIQDLIALEVKKYDEVLPKIEEIKAELMPLKINGIDDEEGYKKVASAIRFVVSKRTAIEEKRKELKRPHYEIGIAIDAKAKEYIALLSPIELHLKAQKGIIDDQFAEIERQKEIDKQAKLLERNNMLLNVGMSLVGNTYIWKNPFTFEEESIVAVNLETMSDEDFEADVLKISKLDSDVKLRQKLEDDQRRLEQDKLKAEQDKLRKEIEEMNNQKKQIRLEMLLSIGCKVSDLTGFIFYYNDSLITLPELTMIEDWSAKFAEIKEKVALIDEKVKQQKIENEQKRQKEIEEAADLKAKEFEEQEKERIAGLSDKEKINDYVSKLFAIKKPEVKTLKYKNILQGIEKFLSTI